MPPEKNKDLPVNNSELVTKKVAEDIALLQEAKAAALLAQGKTATYIKDRVYKYKKEWWDKWHDMLNSEDSAERKTALIEYNKLQAKILPTQLQAGDNSQVQINIIGMGIDVPQREIVEGEIT